MTYLKKPQRRDLRVRIGKFLGRHNRWNNRSSEWLDAVSLGLEIRKKGMYVTDEDARAWKGATSKILAVAASGHIRDMLSTSGFARRIFKVEEVKT